MADTPLFLVWLQVPQAVRLRPAVVQEGGQDMSRREEYEEKTERLLAPIAQPNGVSVYDEEYVK